MDENQDQTTPNQAAQDQAADGYYAEDDMNSDELDLSFLDEDDEKQDQ